MSEKNPADDASEAQLAADDGTPEGDSARPPLSTTDRAVEESHDQAGKSATPQTPIKLSARAKTLARNKRNYDEKKLASRASRQVQSTDVSKDRRLVDTPPSDNLSKESSLAPIEAAVVTDTSDMMPKSEPGIAADIVPTASTGETLTTASDSANKSSAGSNQEPASEVLSSDDPPGPQNPVPADAPVVTPVSSTAPTLDRPLTSSSAAIDDKPTPEHEEPDFSPSAASEKGSVAPLEEAETTPVEPSESLPFAPSETRILSFDDVRTAADLIAVLTEVKPTPKIHLPTTSPVRTALSKDATPLDDLHIEIDRLAEIDTYLEIALSLISAAEKFGLTGRARTTLSQISALLLSRHPELSSLELELEQVLALDSATTNLNTEPPRHSDIAESCRLIDQRISKLGTDSVSGRKWKPADAQKLRTNSILTLILLSAENDDWDSLRYIQALATHVWSPPAKTTGRMSVKPKFDRTSLIVAKPAHGALATVLGELEGQITARGTEVAAAQDETSRAIARAETARQQIEALHAQLLSKDDEITELKAAYTQIDDELALEKAGRRSDRTKAINKIETLRETVTPIITRQISVLEDALDALRRDRPHVTDQFVDRSIAELQRTRVILHPDDSPAAEGGVK